MGLAGFIEDPAAAVTLQEGLSPLDGNQRDKEETDVMVQALQPGWGQAALRAGPRLIIYLDFLRLHAPDKKEEDPPPDRILNCLQSFLALLDKSVIDRHREFNDHRDFIQPPQPNYLLIEKIKPMI
jgi:hypothetical protein